MNAKRRLDRTLCTIRRHIIGLFIIGKVDLKLEIARCLARVKSTEKCLCVVED
jgi:hypothetical protein